MIDYHTAGRSIQQPLSLPLSLSLSLSSSFLRQAEKKVKQGERDRLKDVKLAYDFSALFWTQVKG